MIKAILEASATIGLMLGLFALFGVVIIITDKMAEFHKQGIARVRKYEEGKK